MKAYKSSHED